jgi:glutathione synthase/RimK-type ligase-like ATP-grasp enzyme
MLNAPNHDGTLGIFYEHPEWFEPMFAEFERRGVKYERLLADQHSFDPAERQSPYRLVLNRMSPSAFTRGKAHAIPYTLQYLAYLKAIGADVIGGYDAYVYEFSKARQLELLARLGLPHPRARVINHASQAPQAAEGLTFPVVIKPNIGGSGAGIKKFDTPAELKAAALTGRFELGLDHTALVQEYLPPREASIVRVEVLGGEILYAIKLLLESPTSFNLCPADYCRPGQGGLADGVSGRGVPVEGYTPPSEVTEAVKRITEAADIDVGGVEYLVNDRDGQIYFYDINALSNFVADAPNVVGFDPFPKLVDFVLARAGLAG